MRALGFGVHGRVQLAMVSLSELISFDEMIRSNLGCHFLLVLKTGYLYLQREDKFASVECGWIDYPASACKGGGFLKY